MAKREPHSRLPEVEAVPQPQPHQEWEMDAQGQIELPSLGQASIINLIDRATSLHVGALLCPQVSKPNQEHYRTACRLAFVEFGLPQQISLDHDSAFVSTSSASPFPTAFVLWLVALGVQVRFIQAPPPQEHARVEGRHALAFAQALQGRPFASWGAVQQALDQQRAFTNRTYPVPKLNYQPRLTAFPQARHSGRSYHPQHEAALLDLERAKHYLSQGRWYRNVNRQGQCSLGGYRYTLGKAWAGRRVSITYDLAEDALAFTWKEEHQHQSMKGLDRGTLLGQTAPWQLPATLQLPLPFPPPGLPIQAFLATTFPDWCAIRH